MNNSKSGSRSSSANGEYSCEKVGQEISSYSGNGKNHHWVVKNVGGVDKSVWVPAPAATHKADGEFGAAGQGACPCAGNTVGGSQIYDKACCGNKRSGATTSVKNRFGADANVETSNSDNVEKSAAATKAPAKSTMGSSFIPKTTMGKVIAVAIIVSAILVGYKAYKK